MTSRLLAAVVALAAFGASAQTMYKWVDEKGVTHFSEHPPADDKGKAQKVTPKVTPPSGSGTYDPNAWRAKESEVRKRQVERGKDELAETRQKEARRKNCGISRQRLSSLQESNDVIRYNDKGEKEFLSEKERAAEIANARDLVKEYCD